MKKNLLTLVVVWLVSCATFATGIDRQQAVQLARDFMATSFSEKSAARRAAQTIPLDEVKTGQSLVYAFNVEGGGYVVAGDDCAPAILGFSETSTIDPQDIPDGIYDLQGRRISGKKGKGIYIINGKKVILK